MYQDILYVLFILIRLGRKKTLALTNTMLDLLGKVFGMAFSYNFKVPKHHMFLKIMLPLPHKQIIFRCVWLGIRPIIFRLLDIRPMATGLTNHHRYKTNGNFPIAVTLTIWGKYLSNKKIIFHCDNLAVVETLNQQSSHNPHIMALIFHIILTALHNNLVFKCAHLPNKLFSGNWYVEMAGLERWFPLVM